MARVERGEERQTSEKLEAEREREREGGRVAEEEGGEQRSSEGRVGDERLAGWQSAVPPEEKAKRTLVRRSSLVEECRV